MCYWNRILGAALVGIALVGEGTAQSRGQLRRLEATGEEALADQHYAQALATYTHLHHARPERSRYLIQMAVCHAQLGRKKQALELLEEATQRTDTEADLWYYLGRAYHLNHRFDEARKSYELYKHAIDERDVERRREIDDYIRQCTNGLQLASSPAAVEVRNLGHDINSPYAEYVPLVSNDGQELIFTSRRPNSTGGAQDPVTGTFYEDIYVSHLREGRWTPPHSLSPEVNTPFHDAAVGRSADGQKLFLYRSEGRGFVGHAEDLYVSYRNGTNWSTPVPLSARINSAFYEPSATVSPDEQWLFFSSDRPDGLGGTDLYMARRLPDGQWALPRNLGPRINTPYDEESPFMHVDGRTLYFSSKGHTSVGGFDIFRTEYDPVHDEWSEPVNLGFPINTADDDLYFISNLAGTRFYFSASRDDSFGEYDIYEAQPLSIEPVVVKGLIQVKETKKPADAIVTAYNPQTGDVLGISHTQNGAFLFILPPGTLCEISVRAEGYHDVRRALRLEPQVDYTLPENQIHVQLQRAEPTSVILPTSLPTRKE
ncbi:WD40-like Beta Propeller Repeat [Catalinimonas alkaloidigena]|uniref:WD40-like Beta Propeller Repeat n=1 Tax=Catalinimonas alkaloidigena TaxID=1075417 RepID=A0A1G8WM67_9BACT|nr:PD40 domain-containing protein [Catalinimonas alkaloidigena]SDJ78755.1 WD40-like Beta Propeller Repeat [Catalinimonas alkaloidigena]